MEKNLENLWKIKEEKIVQAFESHQMKCLFVKNREELMKVLKDVLHSQKKVSVGGSVTLDQLGIINYLHQCDVSFIDRYEEGMSQEELQNRLHESFFSDVFITSTNALTTDGCLYNIDGTGNRVAAMIYGPKDVIVIAGFNKIFESEESAIEHIRHFSAPANALRLHRQTPCTKTGKCMDCQSPDRICSSYVKLGYQKQLNRIQVIIVNEELGY